MSKGEFGEDQGQPKVAIDDFECLWHSGKTLYFKIFVCLFFFPPVLWMVFTVYLERLKKKKELEQEFTAYLICFSPTSNQMCDFEQIK